MHVIFDKRYAFHSFYYLLLVLRCCRVVIIDTGKQPVNEQAIISELRFFLANESEANCKAFHERTSFVTVFFFFFFSQMNESYEASVL